MARIPGRPRCRGAAPIVPAPVPLGRVMCTYCELAAGRCDFGECLLAESTITLERIGVSGGFESESSYSRTPLLLSNPADCQLTVTVMNAETSTVCLNNTHAAAPASVVIHTIPARPRHRHAPLAEAQPEPEPAATPEVGD